MTAFCRDRGGVMMESGYAASGIPLGGLIIDECAALRTVFTPYGQEFSRLTTWPVSGPHCSMRTDRRWSMQRVTTANEQAWNIGVPRGTFICMSLRNVGNDDF